MPILPVFQQFPNEAALVGRMLAGYTDLEIDLMHCVSAVQGDLDGAIKTMFQEHGNARRITVAHRMAKKGYGALHLAGEFDAAIDAMRYCLRIRNQYAHCNWWDDHSGTMAFANLEELAEGDAIVTDLRALSVHHVTVAHLQDQLGYFEHTNNMIVGVIHEGNRRAGKVAHPQYQILAPIDPPPIAIP